MNIAIRFVAAALISLTLACGGGSSGASDAGAPSDGNYEGIGTFFTNVRVVDLNSNTPPVAADCVGDISIVVDSNAPDVLVGDGQCNLPANFVTYDLVGGFLNDTEFEGEIVLQLSRVDHRLPFSGTRTGNVLSATFSGRTPQTSRLVVDWDGNFTAERP